jgi:hypothetical protein
VIHTPQHRLAVAFDMALIDQSASRSAYLNKLRPEYDRNHVSLRNDGCRYHASRKSCAPVCAGFESWRNLILALCLVRSVSSTPFSRAVIDPFVFPLMRISLPRFCQKQRFNRTGVIPITELSPTDPKSLRFPSGV